MYFFFLLQPFNSLFIALFLLVLPLESLAHGLFHELGNSLGGTCVGYAVVIPTNYCRYWLHKHSHLSNSNTCGTWLGSVFHLILSSSLSPDGQPTLLPPAHVQELNLRSTGMLNNVQRFFSHHMIETYGCDYSTSGLSLEALQAKLRIFMEAHTADGPRHDTYVLYYSGHTHRSGEWALAGGRIITFTTGWISQVLTQEYSAVIIKRNEEFCFVFRKWNLILTI